MPILGREKLPDAPTVKMLDFMRKGLGPRSLCKTVQEPSP